MGVVILSNYRSGTHYLAALFEKSGFVSNGEIYYKQKRDIMKRNKQDVMKRLGRIGLTQRTFELNKIVRAELLDRVTEVSDGDTVCIIHRDQLTLFLELSEEKDPVKFLKKTFPGAKFIHLDRPIEECAISFYFAKMTGQWFSIQRRMQTQADYDFEEIKKIYDTYKTWAWEDEILDGVGALRTTYDYVTKRSTLDTDDISDFVGVPIAKIQDKLEKQFNVLKYTYLDKFKKELENAK